MDLVLKLTLKFYHKNKKRDGEGGRNRPQVTFLICLYHEIHNVKFHPLPVIGMTSSSIPITLSCKYPSETKKKKARTLNTMNRFLNKIKNEVNGKIKPG